MVFYFTVSKTGQTRDVEGTDGRWTRPSQWLGTDGRATLVETAPLVDVLADASSFGSVPSSPLIDPTNLWLSRTKVLLLRLLLSRLTVLHKLTVRISAARLGAVCYVI